MHAATLFFGLALSGLALAQGPPVVNTPASLITCQPAAITFSGGTPPYIISILPGGLVSAAPLFTFPTQTAPGSLTYNVVLAAGTPITLAIRDGTGALNYAQAVTILAGPDSSCVGGAAGGSSSAAGGASSAASSAPATTGASTAVSASTSPRVSSAVSSASSAVSSASSAITSMVSSGLTATGTAASSAAATATRAPSGAVLNYGTSFLAVAGAAALAIAA